MGRRPPLPTKRCVTAARTRLTGGRGRRSSQNIKQLIRVDPGQGCRRRHAAHCGRNVGTNDDGTANNNRTLLLFSPFGCSGILLPGVIFSLSSGAPRRSPCQLAAATQSRSGPQHRGGPAGLSPGDRCLAGTASGARAAWPFWIPGEVLLAKGPVSSSLLGLEGLDSFFLLQEVSGRS